MNSLLFERSTGNVGPEVFARIQTSSLLRSFAAAPRFRFDGGERSLVGGSGQRHAVSAATSSVRNSAAHSNDNDNHRLQPSSSSSSIWAHQAGVSALALERFDGRILISGGSDGTIKLWDLEQCSNPSSPPQAHTYRPLATIPRANNTSTSTITSNSPTAAAAHRFGITHLSFYPLDPGAFLSTSYDQTLKLWSTSQAQVSGSFDLGAKVHTHAMSPVASSNLLVACGTQHPAVKLVDLRSAAAVQSLVVPGPMGGAAGPTLALAWSPAHEHVLAAGSVDGGVRIWDVRRGAGGLVGMLDCEDAVGIGTGSNGGGGGRGDGPRLSVKAHSGPVNGLAWTDDGDYIISAGHDRRIRVWDAATGANTLANFGPSIRNSQLGRVTMFVSPTGLTPPGRELLFFPNETEILVMELHEGTIVTRLRGTGPAVASVRAERGGERTVKNRLTSIVWRGAGGGGSSSGVVMGGTNAVGGIYSAHLDGQIRAWLPQLEGSDGEDEEESQRNEDDVGARKRKALDDAFQSLMGRKITFS